MARPVTRRTALLLVSLVLSLAFAGWQWFRPYEWNSDRGARFHIVHSSLKRDRAYLWLDIHLKHAGGKDHDLAKPVALRLADGREVEPADTTIEGDQGQPVRGLAFRFWLEDKDFSGPLGLRLNDGTLGVRTGSGVPSVADGDTRFFTTRNW
jgi:hypothetical protein